MFSFTSGNGKDAVITIESVNIHTGKNGKVTCRVSGKKVIKNTSEEEELTVIGAGFDTFEALAQMLEKARKNLTDG